MIDLKEFEHLSHKDITAKWVKENFDIESERELKRHYDWVTLGLDHSLHDSSFDDFVSELEAAYKEACNRLVRGLRLSTEGNTRFFIHVDAYDEDPYKVYLEYFVRETKAEAAARIQQLVKAKIQARINRENFKALKDNKEKAERALYEKLRKKFETSVV